MPEKISLTLQFLDAPHCLYSVRFQVHIFKLLFVIVLIATLLGSLLLFLNFWITLYVVF